MCTLKIKKEIQNVQISPLQKVQIFSFSPNIVTEPNKFSTEKNVQNYELSDLSSPNSQFIAQ
jgi:hypothetical protein